MPTLHRVHKGIVSYETEIGGRCGDSTCWCYAEETQPPPPSRRTRGLRILEGCILYFPDALEAVAEHSKKANEKHNPGEPLHWAREKSTDQDNTAIGHIIAAKQGERYDAEGYRHRAAAAWRALAGLQLDIEAERAEVEPTGKPQYAHPIVEIQGTRLIVDGCLCRTCTAARAAYEQLSREERPDAPGFGEGPGCPDHAGGYR